MSQVKNLRAMFEQKGDSSPPDRGRGQSTPSQESPRPLSRVRTNFVTVEKDGRVGLQRDTSSDSTTTIPRTLTAGTEVDAAVPTVAAAVSQTPDIKDKDGETKPTFAVQTPKRIPTSIPEEPLSVTPAKVASPPATSRPELAPLTKESAGVEVKVSAPAPVLSNITQNGALDDKAVVKSVHHDKSPTRKLFVKAPARTDGQTTIDAHKKDTNGPLTSPRPAESSGSATSGTIRAAPADTTKAAKPPASSTTLPLRPKGAATGNTKDTAKTASATTSTRKAPPKTITVTKTAAKSSVKSPGHAVKSPTSPAKHTALKTHGNKTSEAKPRSVAEKTSTAASKVAASKPSSHSTSKKPAPVQTFPTNGIGFVKPKPKSPTRPVQLPSSLTTHTAASATKTRQSLSRQSGNLLHAPPPAVRSPSRASVSTVGTTVTTGTRTLRRQSSTVSRPRPSIGPPPKQSARDHPVTKKEKEVDESFLMRMMRPTQSSASKTADKIHASPPRKQPAVIARKGAVRESVGSAHRQPSETKKIVLKPSTPETTPAALMVPVGLDGPATEAVPSVVEKALTAEEVVEIPKEAESPHAASDTSDGPPALSDAPVVLDAPSVLVTYEVEPLTSAEEAVPIEASWSIDTPVEMEDTAGQQESSEVASKEVNAVDNEVIADVVNEDVSEGDIKEAKGDVEEKARDEDKTSMVSEKFTTDASAAEVAKGAGIVEGTLQKDTLQVEDMTEPEASIAETTVTAAAMVETVGSY